MEPVGCPECRNTGYSGRSGIYEMLLMSGKIKQLIHASDGDIAAIRQQAQKEGMKPLRINGIQKVAYGLTSLAEVARVAPLFDDD